MADDDKMNPMTCSSDHQAMAKYWKTVSAILEGVEAMRHAGHVREHYIPGPVVPVANLNELQRGNVRVTWNESPFLPKFPNETVPDYEYRRCTAPLTNIYNEVSSNLAAKPMAKKLDVAEQTPEQYKKLAENIDGQGNNLHVFAAQSFKAGIDFAIDWILVDFTQVPQGATLADERGMGARPYWVRIPAERMLWAASDFLNGQEIITYAKIYEPSMMRVGYSEVCVERLRIFEREPVYETIDGQETLKVIGYQPATWKVLELVSSKDEKGNEDKTWVEVGAGSVTIGVIPLVKFIPGEREGATFRAKPELAGIAHMQVEAFQQESALKYLREMNGFSMLALLGVNDHPAEVPVGPKVVIMLPMGSDGTMPDAKYIGPSGDSGTFLQTSLEKHQTEMRNLGMQPLATANLTVVTTANVAMKAHSAVQAWTIKFKDALEQAWGLTAKWLGSSDQIEVDIHTDFGVDMQAGTELAEIGKAVWLSSYDKAEEFKRRGVLRDDFDWDENQEQLAIEQEGQQLQPEKLMDPVTGAPVVVTPQHGELNPPPKPPPRAAYQ